MGLRLNNRMYIPSTLQDAKHRGSDSLRDGGSPRGRIAIFPLGCKRKLSFRAAFKQDYTAR